MNARALLTAPVRPLLRSVQARIDNAVRAAEERGEHRLKAVATELREAQAAEAAEQHRLRDVRVGDLERPAVDLAADDTDRRAARSLVDEVRVEHGRTQAGLAAIAFYEERIARLERAAASGAG